MKIMTMGEADRLWRVQEGALVVIQAALDAQELECSAVADPDPKPRTWDVHEGRPSWHQQQAGHISAAVTSGFKSEAEANAFADRLRNEHPGMPVFVVAVVELSETANTTTVIVEPTKPQHDWEREQVEQVFSLTGGELETEPWETLAAHQWNDGRKPAVDDFHPHVSRYWYDGPPEYVERELQNKHGFYSTVRTVIGFAYGSPAEELYDGQGIWKLVETYTSSGERECPARTWDFIERTDHQGKELRKVTQAEVDLNDGNECGLCGERVGNEHAYIYLGGCYEAVYVLEEQHRWEVHVGNIGTVYRGFDEAEARKHFAEYVEQSKSGVGRAGGEDVVLFKNNFDEEIFEGALSQEGRDD